MAKRLKPPDLVEVLDQAIKKNTRPLAVVLAGHNGSGKTTLWTQRLSGALQIPLINADRLTESILPPRDPSTGSLPMWAQQLRDTNADWQYLSQQGVRVYADIAMQRKLPFAFETVFSYWEKQPDGTYASKIDLIVELQKSGYFVVLLFVGLQTVDMSIIRVAARQAKGGHAVPLKKLLERFPRTQKAIGYAAAIADLSVMFDNSRKEAQAFSLARAQKGKTVLYDCRDSQFLVEPALRAVAEPWLTQVVGRWTGTSPVASPMVNKKAKRKK